MLRFSLLIVSINLSLKAYVINAERDLREYLRILMMDLALENGYFWVIFKKETPNQINRKPVINPIHISKSKIKPKRVNTIFKNTGHCVFWQKYFLYDKNNCFSPRNHPLSTTLDKMLQTNFKKLNKCFLHNVFELIFVKFWRSCQTSLFELVTRDSLLILRISDVFLNCPNFLIYYKL